MFSLFKKFKDGLTKTVAAIAAKRWNRAVKIRPDRDDDMTATGKRHDFVVDYEVGFDDNGKIRAVRGDWYARCGFSADLSGPVTGGPQKASVGVEVIAAVSGEEQRSTAELAHFMLWESFKRSCQVQNYMLNRMTSSAVEMNQRFVQELETMRGSYTKALERIDGMEFEKRMLEHEAASRRLTAHYQRLVEADHRAAERRRDDDRSALEQFARGVMRVVDAIGDPNNGSDKN